MQQTLSGEAASVVKYAVSLARRRGHGQVTPLHVAITMLQGCPTSGSINLMRRACLQSHSHPLQCRALELCFNVALNRLPTSSAGPTVHAGGVGPSLSNALVAAFKRAQANQRRGCVEHQAQQPLLGVKVEMEQLIMSILDDPSVSRVMREAGFSSPQVKKSLEEAVNSISMPKRKSDHMATPNMGIIRADPLSWQNPQHYFRSPEVLPLAERLPTISLSYRNEDVMAVVDNLTSTKKLRNTVIVGECVVSAENVVKDVIVRVHRGDFPEPPKSAQFINPQFSCAWFRVLNRDYVEQKLSELKRTVSSAVCEGRGAIVYLGDLRWSMEGNGPRDGNYCPVNHVTMELGRIMSSYTESRRLWLMATATYQTYLKFQKRQPSLETLWGLHPVPVPAGSLGLSLDSRANEKYEMTKRDSAVNLSTQQLLGPLKTPISYDESGKQPSCYEERSAKLQDPTTSTLPSWLKQYNNDNTRSQSVSLAQAIRASGETDLRERSSHICCSIHGPEEMHFDHFPCRDHSTLIYVQELAGNTKDSLMSNLDPQNQDWSKAQSHDQAWSVFGLPLRSSCPPKSSSFSSSESSVSNIKTHQFQIVNENEMADLQQNHDNPTKLLHGDSTVPTKNEDVGTTLALGRPSCNKKENQGIRIQELIGCSNNCYPLPVSIETASPHSDGNEKYKQLDAESFKSLCRELEKQVAWQSEIIPSIASTILTCRSGVKRKHGIIRINTWFLFLGADKLGQIGIAKALAEIIFGSRNKIIFINPRSTFSLDQKFQSEPDETDTTYNANIADSGFYLGELVKAISSNPHSVIVLEEIQQSDSFSIEGITKAMEIGTLLNPNGDEISLSDAIIIMTSSLESMEILPPNLSDIAMEGFEEEKYLFSGVKELVFQGGSIQRTPSSPTGSLPRARSYMEIRHHQPPEGSPCKRKADDEGQHQEKSQSHNSFDKRNKNSSSEFSLDLNISAEEHEGDNVSGETAPQVELHHHCIQRCFSMGFLKLVDKSIIFQP